MDNLSDKKISEAELIFLGSEIVLKSEGVHTSVEKEFEGMSPEMKKIIASISERASEQLKKSLMVVDIPKEIKATRVIEDDYGLSPSLSLEQLLGTEFPEARWVVENLFESGTINMISAPPNKWKSWIVILCAICVASGRKLFDAFTTQQQAVMIVNEEDSARLLQERCNMLLEEPEVLPLYFHVSKEIKLEDDFTDQLIDEAKIKGISVIIFDSLRSVHSNDENSSQAMQEIMDQLKKFTREGITVLFTHHNRKKSREGRGSGASGEESRGSSAINAGIHGHLSCDEENRSDGKYLVIHQQKLKAGPKMAPFEVVVKHDTEKHKFSFAYNGEYKKEEQALAEAIKAITEVFEQNQKGYSVKDFIGMKIAGESGVRFALKALEAQKILKSKTLKEAQQEGLSVHSEEGKHNTKIYFKSENSIIDDFDEF